MEHQDPFGWSGATLGGKYRIVDVVGGGATSIVYRARRDDGSAVAVKALRVADRDRAAFAARVAAHPAAARELSRHTAGLAPAIDAGDAVSPRGTWTPYLVFEWLTGTPLDVDLAAREKSGLRGRALPDALDLLDSAARAVAVAHERGIVHGDIRPRNVFLAQLPGKRIAKLLDLGVAALVGAAPDPRYAAPEQLDGGAAGAAADVFALALVFLELMRGRPVRGEAGAAVPPVRELGIDVKDAVEAVLARALASDPRARFASAGEMWPALVEACAGPASMRYAVTPALAFVPPGSNPPPAAVTRSQGDGAPEAAAARRAPWMAIGVAALFAACAAGAIAFASCR